MHHNCSQIGRGFASERMQRMGYMEYEVVVKKM